MRRIDPTFLLVKSLSKREKDLFVRYAGLEGQGSKSRKYVDLFRAISKQKKYNEAELKSEFKGDGIGKHFSEAKRSLREIILKVLVYSVENTEKELNFMLLQVDQLMQRGDSDLSQQLIVKGKELSLAEERFGFASRFLELEKKWLLLHGEGETVLQDIQKLEEERAGLRKAEAHIEVLRDLHDTYQPLLKAAYATRGEIDQKVRAELASQEALMLSGKTKNVTRTRFFHLRLQFLLAITQGQVKDGIKVGEQLVELFHNVQYLRNDYPEEYLRIQSNLCRLILLSGDHDLAAKRMQAFQSIESENPYLKYLQAEHHYINILDLCLATGDLKPGTQLMPEIESFLKEEGERMRTSRKFQYYNWLGRFHFLSKDYHAAVKWLRRALDHPPTRMRTDLQIINRVMLLLVYHELGEWELMESLRRSTERFISDIRHQRPVEKRILSFLNSRHSHPKAAGYSKAVRELHDDLMNLFEGTGGTVMKGYYGVLTWLSSKAK